MPEKLNETIEGRIGKYGPYLRKEDDTRSIPEDIYVGDLTNNIIESIFEHQRKDEIIGKDPESSLEIMLKKGPYGYYVQLGNTTKRKAIPKGTDIDKVDLELAISLLSLPRVIGDHPETNSSIIADYGRYGPYIKMNKSNARILGDITPLNITLEDAVELLKKSKKGSSEIKKLGKHPETGEELVLKEGRYGPYISDGNLNASIKDKLNSQDITLEDAVILINARRLAPKKPKRKRKKKK